MDTFLKITKIIALIIPSIISVIILVIVLLGARECVTDVQAIEFKINIGISILGIAISVWVGLNIYNLIEKKEIDELNILVNNSIEKLKNIEPKIMEFEDLIKENEKHREFLLINQQWSDQNESLVNLLQYSQNILSVYHSLDTYLYRFEKLTKINNTLIKPYYINYAIYIKVVCTVIESFTRNKEWFSEQKDIYTSKKITIKNLEDKINNAFNSINLQLQDINKNIYSDITDVDAAIHNYSVINQYLANFKKIASDNNITIKDEDIDSICNRINELVDYLKHYHK